LHPISIGLDLIPSYSIAFVDLSVSQLQFIGITHFLTQCYTTSIISVVFCGGISGTAVFSAVGFSLAFVWPHYISDWWLLFSASRERTASQVARHYHSVTGSSQFGGLLRRSSLTWFFQFPRYAAIGATHRGCGSMARAQLPRWPVYPIHFSQVKT